MATLSLGTIDAGSKPADVSAFFTRYHGDIPTKISREKFRDEADGVWVGFKEIPGKEVQNWQQFLKESGFLPFHQEDGVFGYVTLAGTRLFQEYVRTIEKDASIGKPDGIVGPGTRKHAERWKQAGKVCEWGLASPDTPSEAYTNWMSALQCAKEHYQLNASQILDKVKTAPKKGSSVPLDDWAWDPAEVHLVGIRRNEATAALSRENDDLFVLLLRGLVFLFWGSTDSSASIAKRTDEAFLVEGQHRYRMSWHNINTHAGKKVYKALKPHDPSGVLVFRDRNADNALTEADLNAPLEVNRDINIHWSGKGHFNFSAGCQVIAGQSYINHLGERVDCSVFASDSYKGLGEGKTRGAYNFICDLVLAYTPVGHSAVWYTLGREKVLDQFPEFYESKWADKMLNKMKKGV